MKRLLVISAVLVAFAATAAVAIGATRARATEGAVSWATSHAACRSVYWKCSSAVANCVSTGYNDSRHAQWACDVYVIRYTRHFSIFRRGRTQGCHGFVDFNPWMVIRDSGLSCLDSVDN